MKTQAWTFLTALSLLAAGLSANAQSQDQAGRVKIVDSKVVQTQGGTPHVIGQPMDNSGSAQIVPQNTFSPQMYQGGPQYGNPGQSYGSYPSVVSPGGGYTPRSNIPAGVITHPESDDLFSPQFRLDQRVGELYGYNDSYTGLGLFTPFATTDESLWFLDTRVNLTANGNPGANVGLGRRYYSPYYDAVGSLSGWYDYDDGHNYHYHRGGLSWSYLTRYWRFRANGYVVASDANRLIGERAIGDLYYQGNNIIQDKIFTRETAYNAVDAEIGGPLPAFGVYGMNWAAGAYYLTAKGDKEAVGVQGRIDAQINEDVQMNVSISNDQVFGTNVQIGVQVNIADGLPGRWFRQYDMHKHLAMPDVRNYRVSTHVRDTVGSIDLVNPLTGNPFYIAHIIPSLTPGVVPAGNGSIENPFNSLEAYNSAGLNPVPQQAEIILVRGSDAAGTNLQHGITIFQQQRLLGNTIAHSITGTIEGVQGTFQLPETGAGGVVPVLSRNVDPAAANTAVVTIDPSITVVHDSLTEIAGFTIDGTPSAGSILHMGIDGTGSLAGGLNVHDNTFNNNRIGVNFVNDVASLVQIQDNTVTGAGNDSLYGINITQSGGTALDLLVNNNIITNVLGEDANGNGVLDAGEDTGIPTGTGAANALLDIGVGLNITSTGAGTEIHADDADNTTDPLGILGNTINGNGTGMQIQSLLAGVQTLDVRNNTFNSNLTGVGVDGTGAGAALIVDGAGSEININSYRSNQHQGNTGHGMFISAANTGVITFFDPFTDTDGDLIDDTNQDGFDSNTFNSNLNDGMNILADNSTVLFDHLGRDGNSPISNQFNSNSLNGMSINLLNAGIMTVTDPVNNVVFNNNLDNGLLANIDGAGSILTADFGDAVAGNTGNQFNGNGTGSTTGDGGHFNLTNNASAVVNFRNNQFNTNAGDGIEFNLAGNSVLSNMIFDDNTATGNTGNGVMVNIDTATFNDNTFSNNTINTNNNGIELVSATGTITNMAFDTNTIRENTGAGILIDLDVTAMTGTTFTDNTITLNGAEGIGITSGGNASNFTSTGFNGNTVSNNGSYGLRASGTDSSSLSFTNFGTTSANIFNQNVDAGILLELVDTATAEMFINDTTVSGTINGGNPLDFGDGLRVRMTDNTLLTDLAFVDSVAEANAGDGIAIDTFGNSVITNILIDGSTSQNNTSDGMSIQRLGLSVIGDSSTGGVVSLVDSIFSDNSANGIVVNVDGGLVADPVNDVAVNIVGENLTINSNNLNGIQVNTTALGTARFDLTTSTLTANSQHGFSLVATTQSLFRGLGSQTAAVVFDGNTFSNNEQDGINLSLTGESAFNLDILGDAQQTQINSNRNGIALNYNSSNSAIPSSIDIGNGATLGTIGVVAPPDVVINSNRVDGINYQIQNTGLVDATITNVELTGNRLTTGVSDDGIDISVTGSRALLNPANNFTLSVNNVTATNFNDDGFAYAHNSAAANLARSTVSIMDSVFGSDDFNFNVGDGMQFEIADNGSVVNIDHNRVNFNNGDGIRYTTISEGPTALAVLVPDPSEAPAPEVNTPWLNAQTFLDATADYYGVGGNYNIALDQFDTIGRLNIDDTFMNFNRRNGLELLVASGSRQIVSLQGSQMLANTEIDFLMHSFVSVNPGNSVNGPSGGFDTIVLDPVARLSMDFGNVTPNDGTRISALPNGNNATNLALPTGGTTTFTNADPFKGAGRQTLLMYNVINVPSNANANPNNFIDIGGPIDEGLAFPTPARFKPNAPFTTVDVINLIP